MEYIALTIATIVFTVCLHFFRVVAIATNIIVLSNDALGVVRAGGSDEEKEAAVRHAAAEVLTALCTLLLRACAGGLLSIAVLGAGLVFEQFSLDSLATAAANRYFIVCSTLFVVAAMIRSR